MEIEKTIIDGQAGFSNEATREAEERAVKFLNRYWKPWKLEAVLYAGRFNPVDGYVWDGKRVAAIFEFKSRPRFTGDVFTLSLRKFIWLQFTALSLYAEALLVVETAEGYFLLNVRRINPQNQTRSMYAQNIRERSNDQEPGINISMREFTKLILREGESR